MAEVEEEKEEGTQYFSVGFICGGCVEEEEEEEEEEEGPQYV